MRVNLVSVWDFCIYLSFVIANSVIGVEPVDPSLARRDDGGSICWYDVRHLGIEGRGWPETKSYFDRLPAKAETMVRKPVWNLSQQSAGLSVRFVTDATSIHARWTLTSKNLAMPHMPATGVSGVDLYVRMPDQSWRWLAIGKPTEFPTNQAHLVDALPQESREYQLYLPLYNGVLQVEIGIPDGAGLYKGPVWDPDREKPILFYGTSITQGGCASRPGMTHPAILGRWLDRPVINLGFSGNGKMEPEMATLLAELDPVVYVLDCLPNMNSEDVSQRVAPFVQTLRAAHPQTPILLVEDRSYANAFLVSSQQRRNEESREALQKVYRQLQDEGVENLLYLPGDRLLGADGEDTVDSSHPTDLGFVRQAAAFQEVLEPILSSSSHKETAP
ncbi:MAG: SGNH/GDSL hydrolase family protein [Pirellulales bacterium]|nr:SGNH/GDSL hydrolase family protein [Pirellulales bacterium]